MYWQRQGLRFVPVILLAECLLGHGAANGGKYRMRETVRIGYVDPAVLRTEGNRTVDVVTLSDDSTGLRAFLVDDLFSEAECADIRSFADVSGVFKSQVAKDFPVMEQLKTKKGRQRVFAEADQNRDGALDAKELELFLRGESDIVDHNHTEFMVEHVGASADKLSKKDFVELNWGKYFNWVRDKHPNRFARASLQTWVPYAKSAVMQGVLKKVAAVTQLPPKLVKKVAEDLQLLNYPPHGAHYSCHHDSSPDLVDDFRFMTFFIFLNDVDDGGETVLYGTDLNGTYPERKKQSWGDDGGWEDLESHCQPTSACPSHPDGVMPHPFQSAAVVKPKRGRAIFWYNTDIDEHGRGTKFVWSSMHGGCPTRSGEKWAANVWLHAGPFLQPPEQGRSEL